MSLSQNHIDTVKSTIPLLESAGPDITDYFYQRMFKHNPELQHIFNMSNQHSGKQQLALFSAIAAYAKHIDNLPMLAGAVERIANKHTSLAIQAEHYPIVGHHLIETLRELAGDAFTAEVEEAWVAAYQFLAELFINKEEGIYQSNQEQRGGWRGERKFRLMSKSIESELVKSLVFEPIDGQPVIDYKPGQYIGIGLELPEQEYKEIRQYSLSDKPNGYTYRISVKREIIGAPGVVSNYLHDGLRLGDIVELHAPAGDFFYQAKPDVPVILISAGVGLTPMQSIAEMITYHEPNKPIYFLHACENAEQHSFQKRMDTIAIQGSLHHHTWYKNVNHDTSNNINVKHGYMDISQIKDKIPLHQADCYLCGPVAFMQFAKQQLLTLGVNSDSIFYEVFGPHEAF